MPQPLTIQEAAQNYLHNLAHRNRRPARASSLATFTGHVRRVAPIIGHEAVETFGNKHLRSLVAALVADKLAPKTISDLTSTVKQIIGSVVDENGDQVYPRKWNAQFLDAPLVGQQKRPCATVEQIENAIAKSEGSFKIFYALTAGTGLRIGEALALRIGDDGQHSAWDSQKSIIHVRDAFWRGQLGLPKTEAGVRSVELCRALNEFLIKAVDTRTGFLIASADGTHMKESTLRQGSMAKLGIPGAHSLRRFRITHLRRNKVAEELIDYFTGHKSARNLNDIYSKLSADVNYRREVAESVGLGFTL